MRKKSVKRFALAIAASFVLAGLVLAVLSLLGVTPVEETSAGVLSWIVPIVAGAVIGLVAYLLLDSDQAGSGGGAELKSTTCESCGAEVIEDWRMCPDCGEMLDETERAARKEYRPRAIL